MRSDFAQGIERQDHALRGVADIIGPRREQLLGRARLRPQRTLSLDVLTHEFAMNISHASEMIERQQAK